MPSASGRPHLLAACLGAAVALTSCAADAPTGAGDGRLDLASASAASVGKVAICHRPDTEAATLDVGAPALHAHLAHGDYVTTMLVSHAADWPDDEVHFATIGAALAAARTGRLARGELVSAACRITIAVAAGTYTGAAVGPVSGDVERFPLIVDVPDITLRGALVVGLDASGRATGDNGGSDETTLRPVAPLPILAGASTPIVIANAHPVGSAGHGLTVEGFGFESGHDPAVSAGGQGVLSMRATGVMIRGNRFGAGFTESIDVRAGAADVVQNRLGGGAGTCDVCLAGPGTFRAIGNRLLAGGIPGITLDGVVNLPVPSGVEPLALPASAETWGEIVNNEVRDHRRVPVGTGIRVDALGVGAPNVSNTVHAVIRDNLLVNNRFAMIVHAAFPVANTTLKGDVDVTLGGNVIQQSCQAKLLVSLSRHTTALGLTSNPYLRNSTFQLTLGGDLSWDEAWYGHPAGFGNTLVVDGQTIANGNRQFYSAAGCPAQ
jgi:hypothetical protein